MADERFSYSLNREGSPFGVGINFDQHNPYADSQNVIGKEVLADSKSIQTVRYYLKRPIGIISEQGRYNGQDCYIETVNE